MKQETIITQSGEKIVLTISEDGYCFCPVCGNKAGNKEWRPYSKEGHPTYDICKCGFEFGLDDGGEPPYDKSWERYREKWLTKDLDYSQTKNMTRDQKLNQLKNIGL